MRMCCPGLRVVPSQFPVFSPDEEVERGAVALQDSLPVGLDCDGLVLPFHQPVSGQPCAMKFLSFVEPPVLRDPQSGIARPLLRRVLPAVFGWQPRFEGCIETGNSASCLAN